MNRELNQIYEILEKSYPKGMVPEAKAGGTLYESLVTVMLSAQSKDERTVQAANQLFQVASTPQRMIELGEEEISKLIKPAGLYRNKAKNIVAMSRMLLDTYDGVVPSTREELMLLPGVGRKSADIMLRFEFSEKAIPVDTHVYRLTSRLGLHSFKNADDVAQMLETETPSEYSSDAHMWLLVHGKRVCRALRPACGGCVLVAQCNFSGKRLDISE